MRNELVVSVVFFGLALGFGVGRLHAEGVGGGEAYRVSKIEWLHLRVGSRIHAHGDASMAGIVANCRAPLVTGGSLSKLGAANTLHCALIDKPSTHADVVFHYEKYIRDVFEEEKKQLGFNWAKLEIHKFKGK